MTAALKTWTNIQDEEDAMGDDHMHLWQAMIRYIKEIDLRDKAVLDFGCNQGLFLHVLYESLPYKQGIGVDIAQDSVAQARQYNANKNLPLSYGHPDMLAQYHGAFDIAFSHEVLYLLPDLAAHAALIKNSLKPGGIYYAAIGCHTENPQWNRWHDMISAYSNIDVQNYSLDDYADAFFDVGFDVSARTYKLDDFVPLKQNNPYFPTIKDSLDYHDTYKTLFRFTRQK